MKNKIFMYEIVFVFIDYLFICLLAPFHKQQSRFVLRDIKHNRSLLRSLTSFFLEFSL